MQSAERPFSIDEREFDGKRRTPLPDGEEPKLFVQADVATAAGVQGVVDRLLTDWGGIDIQVREMT